jgi:hypothetical protein
LFYLVADHKKYPMKTLCIRCILWVFSVFFIQQAAQAQAAPDSAKQQQTPVTPDFFDTQKKPKKPKVKKQWRFAIDIDAGAASPNNRELSDVFKGGINASIGIKTAFLKNKLWVRPLGGMKYYFKSINWGGTGREAFRTWKAGVELQYNAFAVKNFTFYPIFRFDNNWSSSQLTQMVADKDATVPFKTTHDVLTGSGYSFDAGIMVMHTRDLYVKLDYEYYKPDLKVNPEFVREMLEAGYRMPENKVFNCSSINLSVGVNLNFKK